MYILLLAPRPAGKARATCIPAAVCKERATHICPPGARAKMHTLFPDGPLAFSLRPSRLSGESAVRNNREDAKSAKNPRRRILSKRQRISTLVVQMNTDQRRSVFICVHLWFRSYFWLLSRPLGSLASR